MKFPTKLAALSFLLTAALVGGCTQQADGGHTGSHEYPAKHGGNRFDLASHGPQVEAIHDEAKGEIKVWIYDAHDNGESLDEAPVVKFPKPPTKVTGKGKGDQWTFTHEELKKHHHDLSFTFKIKGKEYNKSWHAPHK